MRIGWKEWFAHIFFVPSTNANSTRQSKAFIYNSAHLESSIFHTTSKAVPVDTGKHRSSTTGSGSFLNASHSRVHSSNGLFVRNITSDVLQWK